MNKDIFRIEKIKIENVSKEERHQKNRDKLNHERPQNKEEDKTYQKDKNMTMLKQIKKKIKDIKEKQGKTTRKDAVVLYHIMITYSPEMEEKIGDKKEVRKEWIKENMRFLEREFGKENILRVDLHRTETTTHMHCFITPIFEDTFNSKHYINNKYSLSEFQDRHAECMKQFGLKRGEKRVYNKTKEKVRHKSLGKYYKELNEKINQLEEKKKEMEKDILEENYYEEKKFISNFDIEELY